jgi:hypothetical protein
VYVVPGSAVLLEYLQTLTPDRHGTLVDASEKLSAARSVFLQPKQPFIYGIENALPRDNPESFARSD